MKTFVIRVESHDDVLSVCDRMNWAQAQRIVLVLKRRSPRFTDLELTRLARYAQSLGAQLALISRDREIKRRCQAVGIAVFETLAMAQRGRWRQRRPKRHASELVSRKKQDSAQFRRDSNRPLRTNNLGQQTLVWPWRVSFFLLGVLAVMVLMMSLFPSASLTVYLPRQKQTLEMKVQLSALASQVQPAGVIPCYPLETNVEGSIEDTASGTVVWPVASAQATLILENLSEQSHRISSGTIFMTSGVNPVRFEAQEEVSVPPGIGSKTRVLVRAVTPGEVGNVPSGAINQVDGVLNTWLRVYNPEAARGGEDQRVSGVTAQDVQRLRARLFDKLQQDAIVALSAQVGAGEHLLAETVTFQETVEERVFPDIDQPAMRVSMWMKARFRGCAVRESELKHWVQLSLDLQTPEGFQPMSEPTVHVREATWLSRDEALLTLLAERVLVPRVNRESLVAMVAGKEPAWVTKEVPRVLNLNTRVTVRVFPSWWPRMPFLPMRIQVEYQ